MNLPEIGDIVTTKEALELCRYFDLDYLIERIESDPEKYKDWKFDGCSGLPGCVWEWFCIDRDCRAIVYQCCLPHDLGYAYGKLGDGVEKKIVDKQFYRNLVEKGSMEKWEAKILLYAVRLGGSEKFKLSFSWGFAILPPRLNKGKS